ncbi:class I SAM-dependent methyltransferase [Adlercreutzia equolifaciens]|uniref:class I SAM-dependent methyltransferase n=1 Tax=Adlercreutzia equolifaciens TaxID=446660 RepID=UPI0023AF4EFA|nr:class I SAM-dependent methyltransferase [Adlercreutzia equolifaciens]MDE8701733.1 class I SAM-dependent methyltransferase [Adlercreutzia equolifaciens]
MDRASYYQQLPAEGGLVSACRMALTNTDLAGKRILDIGCRRGKGAYKLSELAGPEGFVLGIDWREAFVTQAQEGVAAALARSGLSESNLAFRTAYPEDLRNAGIEDGSFDAVYLNNGITLLYDPIEALRECARALTPGGLLILEAVVSEEPHDTAAIEAARAAGSSIGAACAELELLAWLVTAGFDQSTVVERIPVDPSVDNLDPAAYPGRFFALTLQARKPLFE